MTLLCSLLGTITAQNNVSNIRVQQQDTILIVMYDLAAKADVEAFVSFDGGEHYKGPLKHVSGAIGKGIMPENNKMFVWEATKEVGYGDYENVVIKVVSLEEEGKKPIETTEAPKIKIKYPKKTFVTANVVKNSFYFNDFAPSYGFTVGQFKRWGWYASVMSNFNFKAFGTKPAITEDYYYYLFYSGKSSVTRFSVTAGAIGKILPFWAIYAGVGYDYSMLLWETVNGEWIKINESGCSYTEGALEAGFLFDIKGFTLSIGIRGNNYEGGFKVGIGYAIPNK